MIVTTYWRCVHFYIMTEVEKNDETSTWLMFILTVIPTYSLVHVCVCVVCGTFWISWYAYAYI